MSEENKKISESVIKYLDLLIQLHSSIPCEIRSELRNLQNALICQSSNQLPNLIVKMDEKVKMKEKNKISNGFYENVYHQSLEMNKENSQGRGNRYRANTEQSDENLNEEKLYRTNESASTTNLLTRRGEQSKRLSKNKDSQQKGIERKLSSKGLLKIVKKSKPLTARIERNPQNEPLLTKIKDLLQEMKKNDLELNHLSEQITKQQQVDVNKPELNYPEINRFAYNETEAVSILQ